MRNLENIQLNFGVKKQREMLENTFLNFITSAKKLEENYNALKNEVIGLKEELKQKDIEIKKQENLATIGQTASAIAHEIRNPLGAMKLFVSILKSDLKDNEKVSDTLKQIDTCINTLDNVVSNVLQFSKNNQCVLTPVNIESIIKEQLGIIKSSVKKDIHINECYDLENMFVLGDETSLRRVFFNLFLNSVQAQKENVFIGIDVSHNENQVVVKIFDHGTGIDKNLIDKIFEPFVSTKNEGTGLGLSVVKQILDKHNAKISARNLEQGAEFEIVFNK